jgi:hypothetical protein
MYLVPGVPDDRLQGFSFTTGDPTAILVPEPESLAIIGLGLGVVFALRRRN